MKRILFSVFVMLYAIILSFSTIRAERLKQVVDIYYIHLYDSMTISAWGISELSVTVSVRPDGMISIPLAGDVMALGKTPEQLALDLEKALENDIFNPRVTVVMNEFHKPVVYILGEVANAGEFVLTRPQMLLELLAEAKLMHPYLKNQNITLIRDGNTQNISIGDGSYAASFALEDGDVIYVSYNERNLVYVFGDVDSPGPHSIPDNSTDLILLLSKAQGIKGPISGISVNIIQKSKSNIFNLTNIPDDFQMKPGDIILVSAQIVTVSGAIGMPGVYDYIEGYTLMDYINKAGGATSDAALDEIEIRRSKNNVTDIVIANLNNSEGSNLSVMMHDVIIVRKKKLSKFQIFSRDILPTLRDVIIITTLIDN